MHKGVADAEHGWSFHGKLSNGNNGRRFQSQVCFRKKINFSINFRIEKNGGRVQEKWKAFPFSRSPRPFNFEE